MEQRLRTCRTCSKPSGAGASKEAATGSACTTAKGSRAAGAKACDDGERPGVSSAG